MKYATLLAFGLMLLLPSCAPQSGMALSPQSGTALAPQSTAVYNTMPSQNGQASPMGVYRGAQQAAGAINTVRTLGGLF